MGEVLRRMKAPDQPCAFVMVPPLVFPQGPRPPEQSRSGRYPRVTHGLLEHTLF